MLRQTEYRSPINFDGSEIQEATIDGQDVSEITIDGQQAADLSGIPDSGLLHNYNPKELSGFSDGDTVSTRVDQTQGANLVGSGTYRNSAINGKPAIEYGSGDDHSGSINTISPPLHIYLISNINTGGNNESFFFSNNGPRIKDARFSGANNWFFNSGPDQIQPSYTSGDNDIVLLECNSDPQLALRVNGTDILRASVSGINDLSSIILAETGDQLIGQVSVYDPSDPGYNRGEVESHLSNEWGIAI